MVPSELRYDSLTGRYAIVAPGRGKRKAGFLQESHFPLKPDKDCVFCPQNCSDPALYEIKSEAGEWLVKIIANKFPALTIQEQRGEVKKLGIYSSGDGLGTHEVIISTPHHTRSIYDFSQEEMAYLLTACKNRMEELAQVKNSHGAPEIKHIIIFGNEGRQAGASQAHAHWQLVGLSQVPSELANEIANACNYWNLWSSCIFCTLSTYELTLRERIVVENGSFFAICPYVPRVPYEIWILPKIHYSSFELESQAHLGKLASLLVETLQRFARVLSSPYFNLFFHTAPLHERIHDRYYHFHLEIIPRLSTLAGFELGAGWFMNSIAPEEAAVSLRESLKL